MRRHILVVILLALAAGRPSRAQTTLLLVADKAEDRVDFIDTASLTIVGRARTGRHPHELVATPDGRTAFAANYGAGDSLSVIDIPNRRELRKLPLGRYRDPHGMAISRDGSRLYVTCETDRVVVEIDVAKETILRAFDTGQETTHMVALAPDGRSLFTANLGDATATAIDLTRGKAIARVSTAAGCEGIDVTPDGAQVWTSNKEADTLTVIDAADHGVLATIACAGRPIRVKFTPDGRRALVACGRAGELAIFDVAERRQVRRIKTGVWPIGIVIEPSGRRAFVANTDEGRIAVVDLTRMEIVGSVTVGREPDGMALVETRSASR